jgi:anti-anti-sigma regulatory factor
MPGVDGFEICRTLKANASTSDIPVIFITALTETSSKVEAFQAGAIDFISKPFDRVELLARVRTHLTLKSATKALIEKNARLEENIRERAAAETALSALTKELERRTEELRRSNERLKTELDERARAEAAKTTLQEQIITVQRERLLELSTPLIPITEDILAMPLIGTLDIERAERVVEIALVGASQSRAKFIIIDMTGVRAADANVASMLARLADGLHLLGRSALITGIRPEMAQTLVGLKITLEGIVTNATLQSGIRYALQASRKKVS